MIGDYQKFPIQNFRSGFNEEVEPWLLPRDAYQQMINAHLYRGVIERIDGYSLFAIMSYRNSISLGTPNGTQTVFTVTLPSVPATNNFYAYGTIISGTSAELFSWVSGGTYPIENLIGSNGGSGTVNVSTKVVTITFGTAPPASSGTSYSEIYFEWDAYPTNATAIMGIKTYYASNASKQTLIFDTRRVGMIVPLSANMTMLTGLLYGISEIPHAYVNGTFITGDGTTVTFTGNLGTTYIVPGSINIVGYTIATGIPTGGTINDNGAGGLIGNGGVTLSAGTVNYQTGAYSITFSSAPASTVRYVLNMGIFGNLFTGGISNFFTYDTYQYVAYFTNGVDPVFYYSGTFIFYLNTNLSVKVPTSSGGALTSDISRALHLVMDQQRLVLLNVIVDAQFQQWKVYWSRFANPLDWTNDEFLPASTSEPIVAFGLINTDLIVRFKGSERILRYTGDFNSPFRFDTINTIWACDSPYGTINYDKYITTVGKPAIVASDAVNVKRADLSIPDFTDSTRIPTQTPMPFINQTSIQQCYGQRFDDIKEGWLCYNSNPIDESGATASDNVLAFNYLDETWAVYSFPFSCLGLGEITNVPTWGNTHITWGAATNTWGEYALTMNALIDLGGDQFGKVYELNDDNFQTNVAGETIPVAMSVISKNLNPFIEDGQLARLGFIDLLVTANATTTLRVQFFVNDQLYEDGNGVIQGWYQESILTFTPTDAMSPTTMQVKVWKRIYVGAVGKIHTIRFYQNMDDLAINPNQPIFIHSMVLYMKPAGRIFN